MLLEAAGPKTCGGVHRTASDACVITTVQQWHSSAPPFISCFSCAHVPPLPRTDRSINFVCPPQYYIHTRHTTQAGDGFRPAGVHRPCHQCRVSASHSTARRNVSRSRSSSSALSLSLSRSCHEMATMRWPPSHEIDGTNRAVLCRAVPCRVLHVLSGSICWYSSRLYSCGCCAMLCWLHTTTAALQC